MTWQEQVLRKKLLFVLLSATGSRLSFIAPRLRENDSAVQCFECYRQVHYQLLEKLCAWMKNTCHVQQHSVVTNHLCSSRAVLKHSQQ